MTFTLGLAQTCHPADGDVIALVEQYMGKARAARVDLLVFPESLMSRYEAEKQAFMAEAQEVGGAFTQAVDALAAQYNMWTVYTMNEKNPLDGLPFNTALVVDDEGKRHCAYRKVHLFDSHTTSESERMSAGDMLPTVIDTPFCKLGVGICYDLRFPELAHELALRGCELMVYPSAWVAGECKKQQWLGLLAGRAIENEMFVAGVSRADGGYVGSSCVVDPQGTVLVQGGSEEELLTCEIDLDVLYTMRSQIPVFEHRRADLYGAGCKI